MTALLLAAAFACGAALPAMAEQATPETAAQPDPTEWADEAQDVTETEDAPVYLHADAQEVARRAQEIKEETALIRKQALKEAARRKEEKRVANRQAVADFAVQFVGNPYVWGGTSLTNGADCSGFVMSVFANFGY